MNAREWLANTPEGSPHIALIGAPIARASISPSEAWSTPAAFREALARFSTWDAQHELDVASMAVHDLGDVPGDRDEPDATAAHQRIEVALGEAGEAPGAAVIVIGGDNSLTRPAMRGLITAQPQQEWGLLTLDAHHDCRPLTDRSTNGSPVRELIEAGLPGDHVAQVGIHPFANDPEHARWARSQGVNIYGVSQVRSAGVPAIIDNAVSTLRRAGVSALYVDFDIDVVDRAFAPACPASMPGGLTPVELLTAAHRLGREPTVQAADFTEVDANNDVNGMTVRLVAAAFLAFCSGVAARPRTGPLQSA